MVKGLAKDKDLAKLCTDKDLAERCARIKAWLNGAQDKDLPDDVLGYGFG